MDTFVFSTRFLTWYDASQVTTLMQLLPSPTSPRMTLIMPSLSPRDPELPPLYSVLGSMAHAPVAWSKLHWPSARVMRSCRPAPRTLSR